MKAVLMIDMPTRCGECPVKCRMRGINHVPTWCPLRPLPQNVKAGDERFWKLKDGCIAKEHIHYEFANGWNACLNEITGETE